MAGDANPVVLVTTLPTGTTMADATARAQFGAVLQKASAAVPRLRVLSYPSTNDPAFISKDGRTTFAMLALPFGLEQGSFGDNGPTVKLIQQTAGPLRVVGAPIHVTGIDALSSSEGTGGALILFLSFVSLSTVPNNDVKVLATGLAVGILLDATIVRALLVPAIVSLMGHWNWWLPALPARLLRVKPSRATAEPVA